MSYDPCHEQKHVHEVLGSVKIKEKCGECHNHRFATVTDEEKQVPGGHVHNIKFRTDFYEDHYHEFTGTTSRAFPLSDGRHVHFLKSVTDPENGHTHEFRVATLIEDPIGD